MLKELTAILSDYFEVGSNCYHYILERVKHAELAPEDFREYDEDDVAEIAEYLLENGVTLQDSKPMFLLKPAPDVDADMLKALENSPVFYSGSEETIIPIMPDRWIPVTERLPENEVDVLVLAERRLYGISETDRRKCHIVATAFHTDGKMNTEDSGYTWELDNVDMEYDEEADAFIVPEGWWEAVRYGEEFAAVDDFVTHWMPLPKPPQEET